MPTHCNLESLDFGSAEGRSIVAGFDGGQITSNSGALLLGAAEKAIGLLRRFVAAFTDTRDADLVEYTVSNIRDTDGVNRAQLDPVFRSLGISTAPRPAKCRCWVSMSAIATMRMSRTPCPGSTPT
jgi:hypothetical protein